MTSPAASRWDEIGDIGGADVTVSPDPPADPDVGDLWVDSDGVAGGGAVGGQSPRLHRYRSTSAVAISTSGSTTLDVPIVLPDDGAVAARVSLVFGATTSARDRGTALRAMASLRSTGGAVLDSDPVAWECAIHRSYDASSPSDPRNTLTFDTVSAQQRPAGSYVLRLTCSSPTTSNGVTVDAVQVLTRAVEVIV